MRIKEEKARKAIRLKKAKTPLAKEIELRREDFIRGILDHTNGIINQQLAVASLPVAPGGDDNDSVMKATNALLDRVFGKPKETVDFSGNVQFSLKALAQERLKIKDSDVTSLEDMVE